MLVTGGNRGIGRDIARAFVQLGDHVAVTYRSGEPPDGVFAVKADVTDPASLNEAFAAIEQEQGPVEVLVANAGVTNDTLVLRMSDDDFASVLDANLAGGFKVAKRAVQKMMRARWGRIIFISSVVGATGQAGPRAGRGPSAAKPPPQSWRAGAGTRSGPARGPEWRPAPATHSRRG